MPRAGAKLPFSLEDRKDMNESPIPPLPDGKAQDAWGHYAGVDFKVTVVLTDQTNVALLLAAHSVVQ